MRKHVIDGRDQGSLPATDRKWLELDRLAQVTLTSEDAHHPIEGALIPDTGAGWRAREPGEQTIRLLFDKPQRLTRIQLTFQEQERERTQEFMLSWSSVRGTPPRQIVRQQYNFSPPGTTREVEDYTVDLPGVTLLELTINPDIGGGDSRATLAGLRLA